MFLLNEPDKAFIRRFIEGQRDEPFSYPEVGASRTVAPGGYDVDHNRVLLGKGRETFSRAVEAVKAWRMFDVEGIRLCWTDAPIAEGVTVAILARHFGFWSLSASRIVYVVEEEDGIERYGFAYGTLPGHVERGEERFSVEYHHGEDEVWYDLYAFSRPKHPLVRAGYPIGRLLQRRFARESKRAMVAFVDRGRG